MHGHGFYLWLKRTHAFLLQSWEAMYKVFIECFVKEGDLTTKMESVKTEVLSAIANGTTRLELMEKLDNIISADDKEAFSDFVEKQSEIDDIWKFWSKFLFVDCQAYIHLF